MSAWPQPGPLRVRGRGPRQGLPAQRSAWGLLVAAQGEQGARRPETLSCSWLGRGGFHSNSPLVLIDEESSVS